ncbi:MAG TPA: LysR family transcriptional regulator [Vineibacter sp.]|nr:LysR family transcriptional regulator [Vineibacter sp.]
MDPTSIACFAALAETRNFTRAARRCGLSQPALTRALHRLQQQATAPLFERRRNDVRLTEEGMRVLASLRLSTAA